MVIDWSVVSMMNVRLGVIASSKAAYTPKTFFDGTGDWINEWGTESWSSPSYVSSVDGPRLYVRVQDNMDYITVTTTQGETSQLIYNYFYDGDNVAGWVMNFTVNATSIDVDDLYWREGSVEDPTISYGIDIRFLKIWTE